MIRRKRPEDRLDRRAEEAEDINQQRSVFLSTYTTKDLADLVWESKYKCYKSITISHTRLDINAWFLYTLLNIFGNVSWTLAPSRFPSFYCNITSHFSHLTFTFRCISRRKDERRRSSLRERESLVERRAHVRRFEYQIIVSCAIPSCPSPLVLFLSYSAPSPYDLSTSTCVARVFLGVTRFLYANRPDHRRKNNSPQRVRVILVKTTPLSFVLSFMSVVL